MASSVNMENDRFKAPSNYIREFLQVITYYGRSSVIILVLGPSSKVLFCPMVMGSTRGWSRVLN